MKEAQVVYRMAEDVCRWGRPCFHHDRVGDLSSYFVEIVGISPVVYSRSDDDVEGHPEFEGSMFSTFTFYSELFQTDHLITERLLL